MRYELLDRDYRVFLDVEDLPAGSFDSILLSTIASSKHFLLIVSKNAFDGVESSEDWLRQEMKAAICAKCNIVPLVKENAKPPHKIKFPRDVDEICRKNWVNYSHEYYGATIEKLIRFLE